MQYCSPNLLEVILQQLQPCTGVLMGMCCMSLVLACQDSNEQQDKPVAGSPSKAEHTYCFDQTNQSLNFQAASHTFQLLDNCNTVCIASL